MNNLSFGIFRLFTIFFSLLILLSLSCEKKKKKAPPPPGVIVEKVEKKSLTPTEKYIGQTVADKTVNFVARVEGFLEKRCFKEGADVKKGDLLFLIEETQYKGELESAEAMVSKADAELKDAKIVFERQKKLLAKKAISQARYDNAEAAYQKAKAELLDAKAKKKIAELNLSYTKIKAPFDGRIGLADYDEGNLVDLSSGTLANIVSLQPMKVEFNINEPDFISILQKKFKYIKNKKKASFQLIPRIILPNGKMYSHSGKLVFVDNKVNSSTGTIKVRADFPNPDKLLLPGLYVKVRLESSKKINKLCVPVKSVQQDIGGYSVMLVDKNNKVKISSIKIGKQYGSVYSVTGGTLKSGDKVITQGLQKVRDGMKVNPSPGKSSSDDSEKGHGKDSADAQ